MPNFSERVRRARGYAKLSQAALAARLGVKQQAVQYLESPKNKASGSKHTNAIAQACGVSADWLASGKGPAPDETRLEARQAAAPYGALSPDAIAVAEAWMKLSTDTKSWTRDVVFMLAAAERKYPWLRRGRPKSETYDEFERRMEQNFSALKVLRPRQKT